MVKAKGPSEIQLPENDVAIGLFHSNFVMHCLPPFNLASLAPALFLLVPSFITDSYSPTPVE